MGEYTIKKLGRDKTMLFYATRRMVESGIIPLKHIVGCFDIALVEGLTRREGNEL